MENDPEENIMDLKGRTKDLEEMREAWINLLGLMTMQIKLKAHCCVQKTA